MTRKHIPQDKRDLTDETLPVYTITCMDNTDDCTKLIKVNALHFRDDKRAIAWAALEAKALGWNAWLVVDEFGGNVQYVNRKHLINKRR